MADPFSDRYRTEATHQLDANPFSDPTVEAASKDHYAFEPQLDEDEPTPKFAPTSTTSPTRGGGGGAGGGRQDDTATRLEEIRRREIELEQRERNLGQREEHVRNYGRNNWPPFYPLFFHSIEDEISADKQADVRTLYRGWLFLILVLIWNLVCGVLLLTSGASDGGKDIGNAIMYLPVIGALSFLLWYRPVYNAYAKESAVYYLFYFFFGGFHVLYCIYMFIGVPGTGSGGLINCISAFGRGSIVTGVFCVIATVGWGILALGNAWLWRAVYMHYNNKGHTFAEAKSEMAQKGIMAYFGRGPK